MKKAAIVLASLVLTFSSFAIPAWDKPIFKTHAVADPTLDYYFAWVDHIDGFMIGCALSNWAEREMKLTIKVRTYARINFTTWAWVWYEYNIYIHPYDGNGGGFFFNVNPAWQYQGSYNSSGDFLIDQDQLMVTYYGPI